MSIESDDESVAVVLDIGSYHLNYGLSGEDEPAYRGLSTTGNGRVPIMKGKLTDRDLVDEMIKSAVSDLEVKPEDKFLMMSNSSSMSFEDKVAIGEVVLEGSDFPGFMMICDGALGLYATGRSTGICLDIGYSITTAVPVYEGYPLLNTGSILTSPISGQELDNMMKKLNTELAPLSPEVMTQVKEQFCTVSQDSALIFQVEPSTFTLPDKTSVSVGNEAKIATELLFTPHHFGIRSPGCHELLHNSVHATDSDAHREFFENVVPMGGTFNMPGFTKRLESELIGVVNYDFNVINPTEPKDLLSWIGGSIIASLSTFEEMWVFRHEYEEEGMERMGKKKLLF